MEFTDVILTIVYIVLAVAIGVTLWSYCRMRWRSTGRGAVQNGIKVRVLDLCLCGFVVLVAVCARLFGDGSVADVMLISLFTLIIAAVIVVAWSMIRCR